MELKGCALSEVPEAELEDAGEGVSQEGETVSVGIAESEFEMECVALPCVTCGLLVHHPRGEGPPRRLSGPYWRRGEPGL